MTNLFNKKLISLRLQESLLSEFDNIRSFTKLQHRTEMFEHAMRLYITYVLHQVQHGEDFE